MEYVVLVLSLMWPTLAASLVLAAMLLSADGTPRRIVLAALGLWLATSGASVLGRGGMFLPEWGEYAFWYDVLGALLATGVPLALVVVVLLAIKRLHPCARAAVSVVVGIAAALPMPLLLLVVHCGSGDCI